MKFTRQDCCIIVVLGVCLVLAVPATASIHFEDDFEGSSVDSFWQMREQAGSVSLTNDEVFSGSQSVQLCSEYNTGQKEIWLYHDFGKEMYGHASVWFYDTGADIASSNYMGMQLRNQALGVGCGAGTMDYDLGTPDGGSTYRYGAPVGGGISSVDRTAEWHLIEVTVTAAQASVRLDGQVLWAGPGGVPFDLVAAHMYGPYWRPAFVSYWDDFSVTAYPASVIPVTIDIKPGSYPNAINLGSNGVIPVAILSDADFDATTVDADTVSLAGADVAVRGKGNKYLAHEEDVNADGLPDLVVQVETENLDPSQLLDGYAIITGSTYDGVEFEGQDEITIVPPEN